MIAIGGVIGAGLFISSSAAIAAAGPAILIGYLATGGLVVLIMRMLGEMLIAQPRLGSFVDYIRAGNGAWAGFLAGWLYYFFWTITIGSEAIGGALILRDWVAVPVWALSVGLVMLVLLINVAAVHLFGECEFWLSLSKIVCLIGFSGIAMLYALHILGHDVHVWGNLTAHGGFAPHGWIAVVSAIPTLMFSMMGSEVATVAAAESQDAEASVARVTRSVGMRIAVFYIVSIALVLCVVPWTSIAPGQSPFVVAMEAMGVPGAALILRIVVLSAVTSCLNSSIYITSRTLAGLASQGDAPRRCAHLSDNGVPVRAVVLSSVLGLMVAFCSILSPNGIFAFLVGASGAVILFVYFLIVRAHKRLRATMAARGTLPQAFRLRFCPLWNNLAMGAIALVVIAMALTPSQRPTVIASLGTTAVTLAAFVVTRRTLAPTGPHREEHRA
ncbi:amino acid permease [Ameyamaea chiangmaiensis]|uniref:Amino acid permease n=2 Tax=Ameyamaea chiangmaiensis TaxID=442969 RepID=A0A850PCN7_9PROT|nr:amino acid permease [Ameyamaea chiangmaiensis]MBS4074946.1 amino acid permease [Ameyamaea chiangmaiensis]NVN39712.1 amino acid permease [Ameyamaea chiangmaiensis]